MRDHEYILYKQANAFVAGKALGKIISSPIVGGIRAGAKGIGTGVKYTGKALNAGWQGASKQLAPVLKPVMRHTGRAIGKGISTAATVTGTAGMAGLSAIGHTGKALVSSVATPAVKAYSNSLKNSPMSTLMGTVGAGLTIGGVKNKYRDMPGLYDNVHNLGYNDIKRSMNKVGHTMQKEASLSSIVKNIISYGGKEPSLMGMAAAASIPFAISPLVAPSLRTMGENLNRSLFSPESRVMADEELIRKEIGLLASHKAEAALSKMKEAKSLTTDMPALDAVFSHATTKDPFITEALAADPTKASNLREVLDTVYAFAPSIATNRLAANALLREAAMSPDGTLGYHTIKLLADTQKSIGG